MPGFIPEIEHCKSSMLVPEPSSNVELLTAPLIVLIDEMRNQTLVSAPFGFTVPETVAVFGVIAEAEPVATVGGFACCCVVN